MRFITLALAAAVLASGPAGAQDARNALDLGVEAADVGRIELDVVGWVAPDRCFNASGQGWRFAIHQGDVGFVHFTLFELVLQPAVGLIIFRQ